MLEFHAQRSPSPCVAAALYVAETRAREKTCKINALRMQMRFSRSAPEASLLGAVAGRLAIGMSPLRSFRFARLAGKCDRRRWPATEARTLPINSPEADGRAGASDRRYRLSPRRASSPTYSPRQTARSDRSDYRLQGADDSVIAPSHAPRFSRATSKSNVWACSALQAVRGPRRRLLCPNPNEAPDPQ